MDHHHGTPPPRFIQIRDLPGYWRWHDLDCALKYNELTKRLSDELGGVVSLRNLAMCLLLSRCAVLPCRGPTST